MTVFKSARNQSQRRSSRASAASRRNIMKAQLSRYRRREPRQLGRQRFIFDMRPDRRLRTVR